MKTTLPLFAKATLAVLASASFLAPPAFAQTQAQGQSGDRGETRGSGGGPVATPHSSPAPSGGSSAPATGSSSQPSGGGATGSGGGNSSGRADSGGSHRGGATGGSGYGVPRGDGDRGGSGARANGGGSGATSSGGSGTGASSVPTQGAGGHQGTGRAMPRDGGGTATGAGTGTGSGTGDGVPTYARPRDGHNPVGTAVPRGSVPTAPIGGNGVFIPGGYYGGYGYYDPWAYGYGGGAGGYGGYYGGYYDPWYGGYPTYPQSTYTSSDEGSLKLKIKPREAEVYVDGYFVGVVDDFDGIFQRLHVESGAHRIEVRAKGYETLDFEVRITPEHTTTYTGELKRVQ